MLSHLTKCHYECLDAVCINFGIIMLSMNVFYCVTRNFHVPHTPHSHRNTGFTKSLINKNADTVLGNTKTRKCP